MKHIVITLAAVMMSTACAPMQPGTPVVTDVPRGSEERALRTTSHGGTVAEDGGNLSVTLTTLCNVERVDVVQRTTERRYENTAPQNDLWAGIGGLLLGGAGAAMAASPSTFASDGDDASTKLSPKEVRGVGFAAIGVGALLLAVPVIDWVRERRVAEHRVERVEQPGTMLRHGEPCGPAAAGTPVLASLADGREVALGRTGVDGRVTVALDDVIPADWSFEVSDRAHIRTETSPIGEVSLGQLYAAREDAAWRGLTDRCVRGSALMECSGEQRYLARFAKGAHALEARERLEAAGSRQRAAEEDAAWAELDVDGCKKPSASDAALVDAACRPLERFAARYPESAHGLALNEALSRGRAVRDRLAAAEEARVQTVAYAAPSTGGFIPYAGNGGGPTQCADGSWSHSSGRGTCSHHGGIGGGGSRSSGGHRSRRR